MEAFDRDALALKTTESVIASLRDLDRPDTAIDSLVAAIEDDRARLLAAVIAGHASFSSE
jgi:hypothetical protein